MATTFLDHLPKTSGRHEFAYVLTGKRVFTATNKWEDLWVGTTASRSSLPGAQDFELVAEAGGESNTHPSGTGVRVVQMTTINEAGDFDVQDVLMNGTTPVPMTGKHTDILAMRVKTAGSYGWTEGGRVKCMVAPGVVDMAILEVDHNSDDSGVVTIPRGFQCAFGGWRVFVTARKSAEVARFEVQRAFKDEAWNVIDETEVSDGSGDISVGLGTPKNSMRADNVRYRIRASVSASGMECHARATFHLRGNA